MAQANSAHKQPGANASQIASRHSNRQTRNQGRFDRHRAYTYEPNGTNNTHQTTDAQTRADYNKQRYGLTNDTERRSRPERRQTTGPLATPKTDRRRSRYRPRRPRAAPTKAKPAKKSVSLAKRLATKPVIIAVGAACFFPQLFLGILLVVAFGFYLAGEASIILRAGGALVQIDMLVWVLWLLLIGITALKLAILSLLLKLAGVSVFFGSDASTRWLLFLSTLLVGVIPVVNIFPYYLLWTWYSLRHPK